MNENVILKLSLEFSLRIIEFTESLEKAKKYVIANQLLKSGTSIGANIKEAQNSESKLDFIHKMKIAAKEAGETEYWLALCKEAENYPYDDSLAEDLLVLMKLSSKIISTSKSNLKN